MSTSDSSVESDRNERVLANAQTVDEKTESNEEGHVDLHYKFLVSQPIVTNNSDVNKFAIPASMGQWWFVKTKPYPGDERGIKGVNDFIDNVQEYCRVYGLGTEPIIQKVCNTDTKDYAKLEKVFKRAYNAKVKYLIIGSVMKDEDDLHHAIKSFEQKYSIPTSHIVYGNILDDELEIKPCNLALNMVKKANMKLGGLNYCIMESEEKFFAANDLIIGVNFNYFDLPVDSSSESPIGETVSIVGYAANDSSHPNCFTGDYIYCTKDPRNMIDILKQVIFECLSRYRKSHTEDPKSLKLMLSVRDCHTKFKIFYRENHELCYFAKFHADFKNQMHIILFNKSPEKYGHDENKPVPGSVFQASVSSSDSIQFEMITHWAPVHMEKELYEAKSGHFEIYSSRRSHPNHLIRQQKEEEAKDVEQGKEAENPALATVKPQKMSDDNLKGDAAFGAQKINWKKNSFIDDEDKAKKADITKKKKIIGSSESNDDEDFVFGAQPFAVKDTGGGLSFPSLNLDKLTERFDKVHFPESQYVFPSDDPVYADEMPQFDFHYWPNYMLALSYSHQLVAYPTSVPVPIRIANSLSRRGYNIIKYNVSAQWLEGTPAEVISRFNQQWTYKDSSLRNQRFSA